MGQVMAMADENMWTDDKGGEVVHENSQYSACKAGLLVIITPSLGWLKYMG